MQITIKSYKHPRYTRRVFFEDSTGKRKYKAFATLREAKAFKIKLQSENNALGDHLGTLSAQEVRAISLWREMLSNAPKDTPPPPLDKTLHQIIKEIKQTQQSSQLITAIETLIHQKEYHEQKSYRYLSDLKSRLLRFANDMGHDRLLSSFTSTEIEKWLFNLNLAPVTINNFRRILSVLFNFGVKRGWILHNPIPQTSSIRVREKAINSLSVEQMQRLVRTPMPKIVFIGVLLQGFCGLRSAEYTRLTREEITSDFLHINLLNGKKGKRSIPIPPNIRPYLKKIISNASGLIYTSADRTYYEQTKKAYLRAGITTNTRNVLRHSFFTYHSAYHQNMAKSAFIGGNSETMIVKHYLNLATQEQGRKYFEITPE